MTIEVGGNFSLANPVSGEAKSIASCIHIARTDEKLNGLSKELQTSNKNTEQQLKDIKEQIKSQDNRTEQQLKDIKEQIKSQDNRLWLMISGLFLALLGAIAKG